jgi:hypothetical protein
VAVYIGANADTLCSIPGGPMLTRFAEFDQPRAGDSPGSGAHGTRQGAVRRYVSTAITRRFVA